MKTKSAKQILEQADRLLDICINRAMTWDGERLHETPEYYKYMWRADRIQDIAHHYCKNIGRHFGYEDGYIPNELYFTQVARDIYINK